MNGWKQYLVRTYDGNLKVYNPITKQMEDFEGGAVPEYSSEDAGKVLTVSVTGELEWSEGGGSGGGALVVHGVVDPETYVITLDKTVSEIMNALNSGTLVLYVHEYTNDEPYAMATPIFQLRYESNAYFVYIYEPIASAETGYMQFFADSLDSYPTYED